MYYALLEGRFLFDFVHEDKLAPQELAKYSALLLPNIALLSDEQCRQIARVRGRPAARCWPRSRPACTPSATSGGPTSASPTCSASARPARSSAPPATPTWRASRSRTTILERVRGHQLIPGAENRVPVAPVDGPILTVVPGYVAYPPELSYPEPARTNEPAIVVREKGTQPAGLLPRRYRAHDVAVRPHRPRAAAAELDPLGRRRESARHDRGRRRDRGVRLGDGGGLRRARAELHESGDASRLDARRSIRSARSRCRLVLPARPAGHPGRSCCGRKRTSRFKSRRRRSSFTIPSVADYEVAAVYST